MTFGEPVTSHDHAPADRRGPTADDVVAYWGPENRLFESSTDRLLRLPTDELELPLPFVLVGDHGSGKSWAVRQLARRWTARDENSQVLLTTATDLRRAFGDALKAGGCDRLDNLYRGASLLIIEDLQQLAGRTAAQQWLVSMLDIRVRLQRPTLVTCVRPIHRELKLSDRLRSRLGAGLVVTLQFPQAETRRRILRDAAAQAGLTLPAATLQRMVTETEGCSVAKIQSLVALAKMNAAGTASPSVERLGVRDDVAANTDLPRNILRETARRFGIRIGDLQGPSRRKSVVLPRAVAMFLMREITGSSFQEVGRHFRRRDHTTVLHAYRKIQNALPEDPGLRDALLSIREALGVATPSDWLHRCTTPGRG